MSGRRGPRPFSRGAAAHGLDRRARWRRPSRTYDRRARRASWPRRPNAAHRLRGGGRRAVARHDDHHCREHCGPPTYPSSSSPASWPRWVLHHPREAGQVEGGDSEEDADVRGRLSPPYGRSSRGSPHTAGCATASVRTAVRGARENLKETSRDGRPAAELDRVLHASVALAADPHRSLIPDP